MLGSYVSLSFLIISGIDKILGFLRANYLTELEI